jgi:putative ABC transport system permease protein
MREVVWMALDTIRTNKLRSGLTILGVVIGITAIVGMTSLIRGFDESLRNMIRQLGPNTIILSKMSAVSVVGGADFSELMRRPNLTVDDAKAIEKLAPSVGIVDVWLGQGIGGQTQERVSYRGDRTGQLAVLGATEQFAAVNFVKQSQGRFFTAAEVQRRRRVVVLGDGPYQALFAPSGLDPVGKKVRVGAIEYTVVGVLEQRPSPIPQADNFVVIPQTTHEVIFNTNATRRFGGGGRRTISHVRRVGAERRTAESQ